MSLVNLTSHHTVIPGELPLMRQDADEGDFSHLELWFKICGWSPLGNIVKYFQRKKKTPFCFKSILEKKTEESNPSIIQVFFIYLSPLQVLVDSVKAPDDFKTRT